MLLESPEHLRDQQVDGFDIVDGQQVAVGEAKREAVKNEKRGRAWLLWSFVVCPCHLPVTMAVIAVVLGGTAFGAFLSRNVLGVGVTLGVVYLIGLAIGFRHLRAASAGKKCGPSGCET